MNIFVLDENPRAAAQMHCDRHVCKMSIEYAQILSTVHHVCGSHIAKTEDIYKPTHAKHPSTLWAMSHPLHYAWLYELMCETWNEYTYRYQRTHASSRLLTALRVVPDMATSNIVPTAPPQCMPDSCRVSGASWQSTIDAYRAYYRQEKAGFATWKNRQVPDWFLPHNSIDVIRSTVYNDTHETQSTSLGR